MSKKTVFLLLGCLFLASVVGFPAFGAVDKFARPGERGLDLVWWPRLPKLESWKHDEDASWAITANVLVPKGRTFADAPAVIYASATYKARTKSKSLAQFIAEDQASFRERVSGIKIARVSSLTNGDGKKLETYSFTPTSEGDWEVISYGEEGDFYLIFAVSAHGEKALNAALPSFRLLVSHYRR
jgi:hypothetical protein